MIHDDCTHDCTHDCTLGANGRPRSLLYLSEVDKPVISANRLGTAVYAFAGTRVYTSYTNY